MNVRHLAELAGILSAQALAIVESPRLGNADSFARLEDVFIRRSEAWHSRLHWLRSGSHFWFALSDEDPRSRLIEEILVSEVLSRVTAGLLAAYGQQHGDRPACRFAADLFNQHQLARRSALIEMLAMADAELPEVRRLDRLRRLAERWTDILLGPLSCRFAIRPLVFEFSRSKEYGQSMLPFLTSPAGLGVFAVGLKSAFPESVVGVPSHAGYHRDTAAAVLGLLPHDLFENPGGLMPLRTVRSLRSAHVPKASPVRAPEDIPPASKLAFSQIRRRPERP